MARKYVTCPKCSHRNDRAGGRRKCQGCAAPLPKVRVPPHARTLRDDSYEVYERRSVEIHGGEVGACGYCRRPKPEHGRHQRDHDHRTGLPRGLACYRCNNELLRGHTLETMRAGVEFLERVDAFYTRETVDV